MGLTGRDLTRDEIERIWTIDRSEVIRGVFRAEAGELVLEPTHFDATGWPPGEADLYGPILYDCFDRGGAFFGFFDGDRLAGVAVLESRFIGEQNDMLQLKFLHVSREYRGQGWGTVLFEWARERARAQGARRLYVSATPSENTVRFYLRRGCRLSPDPDPDLFALEPDDLHLECDVNLP